MKKNPVFIIASMIFLSLVSVSFTSCESDDSESFNIVGHWNVVKYAFGDDDISDIPEDEPQPMIFNADGTFELTTVMERGSGIWKKDSSKVDYYVGYVSSDLVNPFFTIEKYDKKGDLYYFRFYGTYGYFNIECEKE